MADYYCLCTSEQPQFEQDLMLTTPCTVQYVFFLLSFVVVSRIVGISKIVFISRMNKREVNMMHSMFDDNWPRKIYYMSTAKGKCN